MKTKYTDAEIEGLINEVREAFLTPALDSAKETLAKSMPAGSTPQGSEPAPQQAQNMMSMVKADEPTESPEAPKDPPGESADDEAPASAPAAQEVPPDAPSDISPATQETEQAPAPAPEGQTTPEQLHSAYAQLSPDELKMHYEAIKSVVMAHMQSQQPAPEASVAPPAPAPAPAPEASVAPPAPDVMKSAKEEISTLKKTVESMAGLLEKVLSQPKPRAISSMAELAKSDAPAKLDRTQAESKLMNKAKDQSLNKSDRELITKFFMPRSQVKLEEIEHLLK